MDIFLTLLFASLGVGFLIKGSALYAQYPLKAAQLILLGNILMTCTAFVAWNPLFAFPELLTVLTALRSYGSQKFRALEAFSRKLHLSSLLTALALLVGSGVIWRYATSFAEASPAMGLTLLACAFAMTPSKETQRVYRALTILGSLFLVYGSTLSLQNASSGSAVIMSAAFLFLNAWFLLGELLNLCRYRNMEENPSSPTA